MGPHLPVQEVEGLDPAFQERELPAMDDPTLDGVRRQAPGRGERSRRPTAIGRGHSAFSSDTVEVADDREIRADPLGETFPAPGLPGSEQRAEPDLAPDRLDQEP